MMVDNELLQDDFAEHDARNQQETLRKKLVPRSKFKDGNLRQRFEDLFARYKEQTNRMAEERREYRQSIKLRQVENNLLKDEIAGLDERLKETESALIELREKNFHLNAKLSNERNKNTGLKRRLSEKSKYALSRQNALEAINARIEQLHATIEQKNGELDNSYETVQQLERQVRQKTARRE